MLYNVKHKSFGDGVVTKIDSEYATVKFGIEEKKFALKTFNNFFKYDNADLQKIIDEKVKEQNTTVTIKREAYTSSYTRSVQTSSVSSCSYTTSANSLLGPRSQTIAVSSEKEMYLLVGYMARPGRISSIEAEVPKDGRDKVFEELFPGQTYRPINLGYTPSGMPNKLSPQFRINFASIRNCPDKLMNVMGAGNASCAGRINKSKFVITIVQKYGFRFGDWQNYNEIKRIATEKGYLAEFEQGYSL